MDPLSKSRLFWRLVIVGFLSVVAPDMFPLMNFVAGAVPYIVVTMLFDTNNFLPALLVLSCVYAYNRKRETVLAQAFVEWLRPIVIGMYIVGCVWLVGTIWIPRSEWHWLLRVEDATNQVHRFLEAVVPKSIWA